ncbi:unnamed protein product [Rhizophagus irregularis]|nr:unnamed protein product [Rhizophagus irregularis]
MPILQILVQFFPYTRGGGDGTLITTTTSLTSPFVSSISPVTNTNTISTNTNNIDYFNHFNSSGLNTAEFNVKQNKSSIENCNETYKRNHICASVSREASDATFTTIVTTSTMYTVSTTISTNTTVSINTTVISPIAEAAAKAY